MGVYFHPLPAEAFPDAAQPSIKRLNRELRDLFGLEGALSTAVPPTKRSDATVVRNGTAQVDITRVSGLAADGAAAVAQLTQAQIDVINGITNHVFISGKGPVMTADKAGTATHIMLVPVWDAGAASWGVSISEVVP